MSNNNLNIPAILVREHKGKEKQINGTLVSINESAKTCRMAFNGKVYKDIPMNQVLINEGFLDKVKEYGKKVFDFVTKNVKGFIALVDEATGKFINWSAMNVHNIAVMASKHQLPRGVYFAPSASLNAQTGGKGASIDEVMAPAMANDRREIEKFWRRVITRTGSTPDETIEESIQYVNENYYKVNKAFKSLNEAAIYTIDDIKTEEGYGMYGNVVNAKQLQNKLTMSIRNQISGEAGHHADEPCPLVWGAPGIGKTAVINSTIKKMSRRVNLSLITIMLAGYTKENWTLPTLKNEKDGAQVNQFQDCPKVWLPVYLNTADPEERARRDHYCNTGEYRNAKYSSDGRIYEGGVVFMDEYARAEHDVHNIIMGLINEHRFGDDYSVASKWGFVFASNRSYDDGFDDLDDKRYFPQAAQTNRFIHYTYVPTKEGWLEWATSIDPITHKANVPPFITEFISQADEHVWYSTVVNGGYDDVLTKMTGGDTQRMNSIKSGKYDQYSEAVLDNDTLKTTKRLVTPRTWANFIAPAYEKQLIDLLDGNTQGLTGKEMYQKLVDESVITKTDSDGTTYKEYYGGILPNILVDALNNIDTEYWDEEYEIMGGDEELDPTHQYKGKYGRYNKFMSWVRQLIADRIGDNEMKSPLIRDWDEYNSYAKYVTPDVIDSIWETSHMPKKYEKDDDFLSPNGIAGYATTTYSKWKAKSQYIFDVINNKILDSYPGDIYADMAADVEAMKTGTITKDEAEQVLNDAAQTCTYELIENGKPVKYSRFFVLGKDLKKQQAKDAFIYAKILKYSTVCQKFMRVLTWVTKVCQQTDMDRMAYDIQTWLGDTLKKCPDKQVYNAFMNEDAVVAAKRENDAAKRAEEIKKCYVSPIFHMLKEIQNRGMLDGRERK